MPKGKYSKPKVRTPKRRNPKSAAGLVESELARRGKFGGSNPQAQRNYQGGTQRSAAIARLGKLSKQERAHLKAGKSVEAVRRARRANARKK